MLERRFVFVFMLLSAGALISVALLNFVVNPYAQYPTSFFAALVQTSRAEKVALLTQRKTAPEGLILGSSRVLKYEPDYLQRITGQEFFNAGVNYGKPEDFLAMVRLYSSQFSRMPETLLVGVDVHGFNENIPADARLLNHRKLVGVIPDAIPIKDRFRSVEELLSWQQMMSSVKSLRLSLLGHQQEAPIESFADDGRIIYHQREQQILDGSYDFRGALEYNRREYKQLFAGYDRLSEKRKSLFLKLVDECREADTHVVVFVTPMHPELVEYLSGVTTYQDRRSELVGFLRSEALSRSFTFADMSRVDDFGGSPDFFVDGIHPLEFNTRRVVDRLFQAHDNESRYAIQ